jgi:hypothetical protein
MKVVGLMVAGLLVVVLVLSANSGFLRMFTPDPPEAPNNSRADLKVWVNKRSGFYYCPNSHAYGTLSPGIFMSQDQALQTGFQPAPHVPCT